MKTKTVKLNRSVEAFGKVYSEIVLREPSARIYYDLGPLSVNYRSGEIESTHEMAGVFNRYLERCVENVADPSVAMEVLLADMGLDDAIRLRRAFNDFFNEAVARVVSADMAAAPKAGASGAAAA